MANKIGIDFGTTKTMVSYFNPTTGLVELVRLDQTRDSSSVFTTVHADESGNYLFGEDADEQAETDPKGYCRAFKLHLGETEPCLKRTSETAEDLATRFLRYIKEECEQTVFHGEPIETTTITVPVKFSPARKEALRRAAKAAGFQSVVFLPEPEAAGSAFLRDNPADKFSRALVLDWGGGTLDIAIISRGAGGTIRADRRCVEGRDKRIGGEVVDYLLLEHFKQIWLETFEHPLVPSEEKEPALLRRVRKTKFALTGKPVVFFQPSPKEKVEISRERFSQIIEPLLGTAVELVQSTLSKNKELGNPEPDAILLIGGTTLSPVVRETMEKNFPNLRVLSWHHSREAVALGATSLPDEAKSTSEPSRKDDGLVLSSETSFQVDLRVPPKENGGGEFIITDEVLALANKVAISDKPICMEERLFLEKVIQETGSKQPSNIAWTWFGNKREWQLPGAIELAESAAKSLGFREEALSKCHRFLVELSECDGAMTPNEAIILQLVESKFREGPPKAVSPVEKATGPVSTIPDDIISIFRRKYESLKAGSYRQIGEPGVPYRLPDGGWQMDCGNNAAITLRPGANAAYAVTGPFCEQWKSYGGAFVNGKKGKLGYPTADEIIVRATVLGCKQITFEYGSMYWNAAMRQIVTNCFGTASISKCYGSPTSVSALPTDRPNKSSGNGNLSNDSWGAGTGAIAGAAIGSIIPGIGTLAGAGIGALIGGIKKVLSDDQ